MTSQNLAELDGLWPLPASSCRRGLGAGVRRYRSNGTFELVCIKSQTGQNGRSMPDKPRDLHEAVPGQLTIDDALSASYASCEDMAAGELAEHLITAAVAGTLDSLPPNVVSLVDRVARAGCKTGIVVDRRGLLFQAPEIGAWREDNVSMLPSFFDTSGPDEVADGTP